VLMLPPRPGRHAQASIHVVLVALVAMALGGGLPSVAFGAKGHHRHKPGITLSGPLTNLTLETNYTYSVEVVSARSYKHAVLNFRGPSQCLITRTVNLEAYKPWKGSFTVAFESSMEHGIEVVAFTPSSPKGSHAFLSKAYTATFAPTQPTPSPSYRPPCPQPLLGS
jgi:hypothetical protein